MRGSIRKRGSSWQLAVYVGYERGRSRYRYETVTGSRRDAERRLTQLMADVESGRLGPSRAGTLEDLASAWWDARADQLSPTTRREYRRLLDRRILPVLGSKRVDRIKPADIERYYASLRKGEAPGGGKLSAASIRAIHGILRSMFKAAVRWGYVTTNPLREIDPPRRATTGLAPPLPEEVTRLLAHADGTDPELGAYLRLAAASGARRGELGALRWSDLDLDEGEVVIARAIVLDGSGSLVEKDT
jgi:integrase